MGTPDFAVASLRRLVEDGHEVVGVFTQPDKPKNRGMKLTFSPVKEYALTQDLPVYQPLKMRDGEALGILRELAPELIVVAAYGKILPQEILDLPQYGCINVHSSLLPKYRGAAPINWAILNGERITGVSIMYMVAALDAGDVIRTVSTEIGEREDAAALTVKRGSRTIELSAEPEKDEDGEYRLGAWVRDSMAGIGTMTFFDPQSGTFGALGHGVTDVDTGQLLPLDHGSIMDASVKAVKKGERASPGELKGDFDLTRDSGTLYANTECGIFGKLSAEDAAKITGAALPIAKKDEIKTGRATILATVSGNETREYDIEIEKIYSPSGSTRNLLLRVTDEELLAQTGGVVQGMSGSAILQDGKIIGAVTHVLLDDPSRGYGIFIENMLSAAGLSSE